MRKILDPKLIIESPGMEDAVRKAIVLAFKCLREEANARPTISQVVYVLDDLVKFMAKIEKKKNIQNGWEEDDEDYDRNKVLKLILNVFS